MRVAGTLITQGTYKSLFTFDEKIALYTAASTSTPLQILLDDLRSSPIVDLADDRVAFGLGYMVQHSIISYQRMLDILAYRE